MVQSPKPALMMDTLRFHRRSLLFVVLLVSGTGLMSDCGRRRSPEKETTEELLDDIANANDDRVRAAAVRQIGKSKDPAAVSVLIVGLQDRSDLVRLAAIT